jgi:lipoate-protein ligase A
VIDNENPSRHPSAAWLLIVDGEADGATNMAVDEAILSAMIEGASPPTLRFFGWSPPCLSLGRNQPLADVDRKACRAAGVDVVRRATGGRAILHTDELTYSVALLQTDPRATGDILTSYQYLSQGLLAGLRHLGVKAAQAAQAAGQRKVPAGPTAVCFETPSKYEITVGGRKLVGSAQWRARGGVLQHGTLPLCGDITRIVTYLTFSEAERGAQRQALRARATTLEEALARTIPFAEASQAMAGGFTQALDVTLVPGAMTAHENALATELRRDRYAASAWTTHN